MKRLLLAGAAVYVVWTVWARPALERALDGDPEDDLNFGTALALASLGTEWHDGLAEQA